MTHGDESFEEARRWHGEFARPTAGSVRPRHRREPNDDAELTAIAHDEGWLVPPAEVTRVALRPWQQAVFWGLRVYIAAMLVVMAIGFAHVAAGK
jgi:hypothetical protein